MNEKNFDYDFQTFAKKNEKIFREKHLKIVKK